MSKQTLTNLFEIPATETSCEITSLNSRFIATISPVTTTEEAREFIKRIRERYSDASHHVPAFIIGFGNSVTEFCSDDGEPAGTAGRPILTVLRGSGLGDVCLVVTRYFGGTLLGTGGLVKAYTEAAQEVIKVAPRARRIEVCISSCTIDYSLFDRVKILILAQQGEIVEQVFTEVINLTIQFPNDQFAKFKQSLQELSNGKAQLNILENTTTLVALK